MTVRKVFSRSVYLTIIMAALILCSGAGRESGGDSVSLDKGIIYFGAHTGATDISGYKKYVKDLITKGTEVYTSGWGSFEPKEGQYDWSYIDQIVAMYKGTGKKLCIRIPVAATSPYQIPQWLNTQYNVRRVMGRNGFVDFEQADPKGYVITGIISDQYAISGKKGLTGEKNVLQTTPIKSEFGYMSGFDFKAITDGVVTVSYITEDSQKTELARLQCKAGESGSKEINIDRSVTLSKGKIVWAIESGKVYLDNISYGDMNPNWGVANLTFCNYFDPVFMEKYQNFIRAFANKYKDEPVIAAIVTGGFGRWDEPTLTGDLFESAEMNQDLLRRQWTAYGYSDEKYAKHMQACGEFFNQTFKNTHIEVLGHVIAYAVPGDTTLLNWNRIVECKNNHYIFKTNGLSSRFFEWHNDDTGVAWMYDRYKHDPNIKLALETGAQVNNSTSEIMGHQLTVLNRALMLNTDYIWLYDADIDDINVRKYEHYANEQAGSALFTRMFSRFAKMPYKSQKTNQTYSHYDAANGCYTINYQQLRYGSLKGQDYVSTTMQEPAIKISLDDRQEYDGMYGTSVNITYFDQGDGSFNVLGIAPDEYTNSAEYTLGTVKLTDSKTWKTKSFFFDKWLGYRNNSGKDTQYEIMIDDQGKGIKVAHLEVDYVPAREWKEKAVRQNAPGEKKAILSKDAKTYSISYVGNNPISTVEVAVSRKNTFDFTDIRAKLYGKIDGKEQLLSDKEFCMPAQLDWIRFPVAHYSKPITDLKVTLSCTQGHCSVLLKDDGNVVSKILTYEHQENTQKPYPVSSQGATYFEALQPFDALKIEGTGKVSVQIIKYLSDGTDGQTVYQDVVNLDGNLDLHFEPQTAGIYKIKTDKNIKITPLYLLRLQAANKPTRYLLGKEVEAWNQEGKWKPVANLKSIEKNADGAFTALLNGSNPEIETQPGLKMDAQPAHIFHIVIKNETASNYVKVYWKTADKPQHSEERSAYIPVAANDSEYREYSWPIGQEKNYKDTIIGYKVIPAFSNVVSGRISIKTMDIRNGIAETSTALEPLDVRRVPMKGEISVKESDLPTTLPVDVAQHMAKFAKTGQFHWSTALELIGMVILLGAGGYAGLGINKKYRKKKGKQTF